MKRSQLAIVVLAAVAVAVVALIARSGGDDGGGGGGGADEPPSGSLRISFAYSPEKEKLLAPLIERFNGERLEVRGRAVFVQGEVVASGEAESKIADERLRPDVWSPASSLWGRLLDFET